MTIKDYRFDGSKKLKVKELPTDAGENKGKKSELVKQTQVRNSVRVRTQPTSRRGTLLGERGQPESFLEEVKT